MKLLLTLVGAPGCPALAAGESVDVAVDTGIVGTAQMLQEQLIQRLGAASFTVAGLALERLHLGVNPLVTGAVVVVGPPSSSPVGAAAPPGRDHTRVLPGLVLMVLTGPDAGRLEALTTGRYTLGRAGTDLCLSDPELSRFHAVLTVGEDAIVLEDHCSANGVWVDGLRVARAVLTVHSRIRVGRSVCRIAIPDRITPLPPVPDLSDPLDIPLSPTPERNLPALLTSSVPLGLGLILTATTGQWMFLAFSLVSAAGGLVQLLTGRAHRRRFAAALQAALAEDATRRDHAAPDAGTAALHVLCSARSPGSSRPGDATFIRLGLGSCPAAVRVAAGGTRDQAPPWHEVVPIMIELSPAHRTETGFTGPLPDVSGVARHVLLQLSRTLATALCVGLPPEVPRETRFLPGITVCSSLSELEALGADGALPAVTSPVLLFGKAAALPLPLSARGRSVLRFGAAPLGGDPGLETIEVTVAGALGDISRSGNCYSFAPDYVSVRSFARSARSLAHYHRQGSSAAPVGPEPQLPRRTALTELMGFERSDILRRWSAPGPTLGAPLGRHLHGDLPFDLVAHGPHLVVAGTTGSGKSELLRSLVVGIAASHPPETVNFVLLDFKGGSGLGLLGDLPHSVGFFTDLSAATAARALVSLRAEVRRREKLFAQAGISDITECSQKPSGFAMPRLVVVIDEFRMLADQVPDAVGALMRIATIGRSLGIHLVLATQRPQGTVTADIRANITAAIALRVQSAVDSQDVIGSSLAASIPVDVPGRAVLRVADGPPQAFQSATLAGSAQSAGPGVSWLTGPERPMTSGVLSLSAHPEAQAPETLIAAVGAAAELWGPPAPHHPVLPPLPDLCEPPGVPVGRHSLPPSTPAHACVLGLLDLPEEQAQRTLSWAPRVHSHLALIGYPMGGMPEALQHLVSWHLSCQPDRHLYILDGSGSLGWTASSPSVGAYVTGTEIKRAVRVIERVAELIAQRLTSPPPLARPGSSAGWITELSIVVSGWGRWASALSESRWLWAEGLFQDIARDGAAAGVVLVLCGEREVPASRFYPQLPNRCWFPLGAGPETLLSWPRLPPLDPVPGRCFVQGPIATAAGAVAQLILKREEGKPGTGKPPAEVPFRVDPLPRTVQLASEVILSPHLRVLIGVGGDALAPVWLDLPPRTVFLILGGHGTGRTTVLRRVSSMVPSHRHVTAPHTSEASRFWQELHSADLPLSSAPSLLLVDDADLLTAEAHRRLVQLAAAGHSLMMTSQVGSVLTRVPLASSARAACTGLVLAPKLASDGELFGVRLDCTEKLPPGRGYLFNGSGPLEIQVALPGPDTSAHTG